MSLELKIKALSLHAEARIIRRHEKSVRKLARKYGWDDKRRLGYNHLHLHRVLDVRHEARMTHLARMLMKGKAYLEVENKVHPCNVLRDADLLEIKRMVNRYSPTLATNDTILDWVSGKTESTSTEAA